MLPGVAWLNACCTSSCVALCPIGVATSGLEMSQNSLRMNWTREEVDGHLHRIMTDIHTSCVKYGTNEDGSVDYVLGANIAGFVKVSDAMLDQGVV